MESNNSIQELQLRLDILLRRQNSFDQDITDLKGQIETLKQQLDDAIAGKTIKPALDQPKADQQKSVISPVKEEVSPKTPAPETVASDEASVKSETPKEEKPVKPVVPPTPNVVPPVIQKEVLQKPVSSFTRTTSTVSSHPTNPVQQPTQVKSSAPSSSERFIGENLTNKIGIVIILIGIGIGVKYAIDKDLLGPTMRIALGYIAGAILVAVGALLRKKYENFSAVLFGGGMAVAYFVTFLAYDFYALYTKPVAFGIMLVLTTGTILTSVRYNKQIIAIIGLLGAYAVPFLLHDGSGTTQSLFIYMTIINIGVLILAYLKEWKPLYASAFGGTWFVYLVLLLLSVIENTDQKVFLHFGSVFYLVFYATLIAYKLRTKQLFDGGDIALVLINTLLGFLFGIFLVEDIYNSSVTSGIYTLCFGGTHLAAFFIAKSRKESDANLANLSLGMALIFGTISIPIIFDGNWITMLWFFEAALLFWIGRTKNVGFYEKISYIPLTLALFSIMLGWADMRSIFNPEVPESALTPVWNKYFLTGMLFSAVLFFMAYIKHQTNETNDLQKKNGFFAFLGNALMYIFLTLSYLTCFQEITVYWSSQWADDPIGDFSRFRVLHDVSLFKLVWVLIYTMLFLSMVHLINRYKFKDTNLASLIGTLSAIVVFAFMTIGLYSISILRDRALEENAVLIDATGAYYLKIRYLGLIALIALIYSNVSSLGYLFKSRGLTRTIEIIAHICIVWFISTEIVHWKHLNGGSNFYRAGLTILWGVYSFGLIAYGIWKKQPHLRIIALIIFGITLLKLFLYDIAYVGSGSKTIAFISLGVLLLIISFLYNKYKHFISGEEPEKKVEE